MSDPPENSGAVHFKLTEVGRNLVPLVFGGWHEPGQTHDVEAFAMSEN